ncbi:MAG: hypothetical protein Q9165_007328 [Trypethelium subeluteriae]
MSRKTNCLDLIKNCDSFPEDDGKLYSSFYKLLLPNDPRAHGFMLPSTVEKMPWTSDFAIDHVARKVQVLDTGSDPSVASISAFQKLIDSAIDQDIFSILHGQHSEMYRIIGANYPVRLERFASSLFGIISRGAHLTAYTRSTSGDIRIWVPRRSAHMFTYPGMLDSTVAGGVKAEDSPFDCIVHEADEEASLSEELVRRDAKSCGVLTYMGMSDPGSGGEQGLVCPDLVYTFDIELEDGVVPKPRDDEVQEFYLWDVETVKQAMLRSEFKPNCALVMIDFFIRHGIIREDNEEDFVEIATRLHRKMPIATAPSKD